MSASDGPLPSILKHVGNTPLVKINSIASSVPAEIYAKCEFFNAGGSVKDRIGVRMVEDAEKQGRIKPGDTLIEPTSGNTGIGLALAAAVKGYRMIITLPQKMSAEKCNILKALGAEIIRTPTEAAWDSPESHIGVARRLQAELPNAHILDQYTNPSNILAHYEGTGEEIYQQMGGKIDAVVIAAGTGGTITGVGRKLKEKIPGIKVIGVDPHGSLLRDDKDPVGTYLVEGIGYDFVPDTLDRGVVDEWVKTSDKESFLMARRLIREEGFLCGGSSGAAMVAAMQVASRMQPGQRVVVLLADSIRNYMSKFLMDEWMVENGFAAEPHAPERPKTPQALVGEEAAISESAVFERTKVADLEVAMRDPITTQPHTECGEVVKTMETNGIDQLPVTTADGELVGLVTLERIMAAVLGGGVKSPVDSVMLGLNDCLVLTPQSSLKELKAALDKQASVLVVDNASGKRTLRRVVTRIDLLTWSMKHVVTKFQDE
jgi:cystathionine beta-synthase